MKQIPDSEARQTFKEYHLLPRDSAFYSAAVEEHYDACAVGFDHFVTLVRNIMNSADSTTFTGKMFK